MSSSQNHVFQGWRLYFELFVHILGANYCGQDLDFYTFWQYQLIFSLIYNTSIHLSIASRVLQDLNIDPLYKVDTLILTGLWHCDLS